METEILVPFWYVLGYLLLFILCCGLSSFIVLKAYSFFRSIWRYFRKFDTSIKAKIFALSEMEMNSIIIMCGIGSLFMIWNWKDKFTSYAGDFGSIFFIGLFLVLPFVLLASISREKMKVIIKITISAFLLLCLINLMPGDYLFFKYWSFSGFLLLTYFSYEENQKFSIAIYVILVMLLQPIFKIEISRNIWDFIYVIVSVGLIISLFRKQEN